MTIPGSISRRRFLGTAVTSAVAAAAGTNAWSAASARDRLRGPNVVFILTDDLGWADLSIYGRSDYQTPNLDRLARQGTRFTNAYAAQTVCTPTRIAFFTGRYPARTPVGLQEPLDNAARAGDVGLSPNLPTIASLLKGRGYETALIGKWHAGYPPNYGPNKSGFDQFFGHLSGGVDFFRHVDADGLPDLFENETPVTRAGYLTDLITQEAIDFIRQPRDRPFYLSLHYNAPHWPWQGPNDQAFSDSLRGRDSFGNWTTLNARPDVYAAMMQSLDQGVGRVLQALKDAGLEEDTLVIFTSDNGGERLSDFGPFQGRKGSLYEGGLRVPLIVRWPKGRVKANRITSQVAITMDITATILAATKTQPDRQYPLDGQNLLPVLVGEKPAFDRTLFWRYRSNPFAPPTAPLQAAVRSGNWKYLRQGANESLFDLASDPGEQTDLRASNTAVFNRLRSQFDRWQTQVLPYPS